MLTEPTIHQIEELLLAFRAQGGTDAEINALAQDIIRDYRPEKVKPIEEVFEKEQHESIRKIFDFKNDGEKPLHQAFTNIWKRWYIKYPLIFVVVFVAIFATANLPLYFAQATKLNYNKESVTATQTKKTVNETSAPLEPGETIPATPTLVVPKINVTVPIQFINSIKEEDLAAALPNGVVHYYQTALPGQPGNSFITGHSSNYWWIKGEYNYVFANLDKLVVGDQAKIYYNGNKYLYQVTAIKVVEPTDMEVLDQTIKPTMTLMTCTPAGTSLHRLIVSFDQISPVYKSNLVTKSTDNDSATTKTAENSATALPKTDSNPIVDWLLYLFTPKS